MRTLKPSHEEIGPSSPGYVLGAHGVHIAEYHRTLEALKGGLLALDDLCLAPPDPVKMQAAWRARLLAELTEYREHERITREREAVAEDRKQKAEAKRLAADAKRAEKFVQIEGGKLVARAEMQMEERLTKTAWPR